jgi:hypothetical protein
MYQGMLPLEEYRTQVWHGHDGAFIAETAYFWGMYTNRDYDNRFGVRRAANRPVGEVANPYIRYYYTSSPELMAMMLDYYAYTGDRAFLVETLLPTCDSLLTFWDKHYVTDEKGQMKIEPAQALETWQAVVNPTPDVAGLHWVLGRLLGLPKEDVGPERLAFWRRLSAKVPPLPMGEVVKGGYDSATPYDVPPLPPGEVGKKCIFPAGTVINNGGPGYHRGNTEAPELYAVFPFRLYGVGKPDLDIGRFTFDIRHIKRNYGWYQDAVWAALLGLAKTAADYAVDRAKNKDEHSRFPAFWGPNYDYVPDQDHGGNLMMALEAMLLQADDGKIQLLPAWPKEWDVDFKLHTQCRTVIEGSVKNGKLARWEITPEDRRKDVIVLDPQ